MHYNRQLPNFPGMAFGADESRRERMWNLYLAMYASLAAGTHTIDRAQLVCPSLQRRTNIKIPQPQRHCRRREHRTQTLSPLAIVSASGPGYNDGALVTIEFEKIRD